MDEQLVVWMSHLSSSLQNTDSATLSGKTGFNSRLRCYVASLYSVQCICSPIRTVLLLRFMEEWWQSSARLVARVVGHPFSLAAMAKLV